jgi:Domain of unknown function (DUF5666)
MKTDRIHMIFPLLAAVLMLVSCSSSGGGVGGSGIISRGSITGVGSIIVNGTYFNTDSATIVVDGEEIGTGNTVVLDNLDIGRVVTVSGSWVDAENTAVADRVTYNDDVNGPVNHMTILGPETKELTVMGQSVMLNSLTFFKAVTFETIALNDVVEVSGFYDDNGTIWASFLEKTGEFTPGLVYELKGFIASLDTDQETFVINGLLVDYSGADTSGLPDGLPVAGLLVEAEGIVDLTGVNMFAQRIDLEDELGVVDADEVEVMGFVTGYVSAYEFIVGNQLVVVDGDALFVDGTPQDVAPGIKLEAEGTLEDGVLYAEEIEFWDPDQMEIEGLVTAFVSIYEFTVDQQVVNTTAETVYEDGTSKDLEMGVHVEIKGRMVGGVMMADKVSFELGDI